MGIKSILNGIGLCLVMPIIIIISLIMSCCISIRPNNFDYETYKEEK
jgi:hypothetical protein